MISRAVFECPRFELFRPSVLRSDLRPNAARIVKEGRLLSDLTMPERDWSQYDPNPTLRKFMAPRYRDQVLTSPVSR